MNGAPASCPALDVMRNCFHCMWAPHHLHLPGVQIPPLQGGFNRPWEASGGLHEQCAELHCFCCCLKKCFLKKRAHNPNKESSSAYVGSFAGKCTWARMIFDHPRHPKGGRGFVAFSLAIVSFFPVPLFHPHPLLCLSFIPPPPRLLAFLVLWRRRIAASVCR